MADIKKLKLSRRNVLLGALMSGAATAVKAAEDVCACLPAPDCNAVCPEGGTPRGDGTQACDCNPASNRTRALALTDGGDAVDTALVSGKSLRLNQNKTATEVLVFSNNQIDCADKADFAMKFSTVTTAGSAGPSADVSFEQTGTFSVPYFTVNTKGQITSYKSVNVKIASTAADYTNYSAYGNYGNYANYSAYKNYSADSYGDCYSNYNAYTNYTDYSNYSAYKNYRNYSDYSAYANYKDYKDYYRGVPKI